MKLPSLYSWAVPVLVAASAVAVHGQTFTTLYSFPAASARALTNRDGCRPRAALVLSGSTLYGTAKSGGATSNGTVFALSTSGDGFSNLYSFSAFAPSFRTNADGANPAATLLCSGTRLYGTTRIGGTWSNGTLFTLNTDGTGFTNLHPFSATYGSYATNRDGANPGAELILAGNRLYGTAENGGRTGNGTVFALNTDGSGFTNLYSFTAPNGITGINADGANPGAGLVLANDTLYGVAQFGGASGNGTVFALKTNGSGFTVLHTFPAFYGSAYTNVEGANPLGRLLLAGDVLYGTTIYGGTNGSGSLFVLRTNGSDFRTLYAFSALDAATSSTNADGANPRAGLTLSGTTLYGVAQFGGPSGNGTLFAIRTDGTAFTNLHSFPPNPYYTNSDGVWPSGLISAENMLYGTAEYGGAKGSGAIFSLALTLPPMPPTLLVCPSYSPQAGFQFVVTNADGSAITPAQQSRLELCFTTNLASALNNWTVLSNATTLTNGILRVRDSETVLGRERFYGARAKP